MPQYGGSVTFDLKFKEEYDTSGRIFSGMKRTGIKIEGFEACRAPIDTKILQIWNRSLLENTFPFKINETNIEQFIILVNVPDGVVPQYEFTS
ncbi:MAG: hypothetical protein ACRC8C_00025 [Mycoplasmoidaceae bacterium]